MLKFTLIIFNYSIVVEERKRKPQIRVMGISIFSFPPFADDSFYYIFFVTYLLFQLSQESPYGRYCTNRTKS